FKGAHWILCPDADTPAEHFPRLHELVTSIGARVIALPREDHDEAVAVVSHVPHIMASSLVQLASRHADDQQALMRLAAGGFKDSTRIAAGSPELWCGIAFDNKDALSDGLDEIRGITRRSPTPDPTTRRAHRAAGRRGGQPRAAGRLGASTERLLVAHPHGGPSGVVAEVTTVTSSVGAIQSIEIDHHGGQRRAQPRAHRRR
ncbi:MAG: prephenate dehydrogenase dimerization domain-containing protein, partial [Eggerthellaceae bacterium]